MQIPTEAPGCRLATCDSGALLVCVCVRARARARACVYEYVCVRLRGQKSCVAKVHRGPVWSQTVYTAFLYSSVELVSIVKPLSYYFRARSNRGSRPTSSRVNERVCRSWPPRPRRALRPSHARAPGSALRGGGAAAASSTRLKRIGTAVGVAAAVAVAVAAVEEAAEETTAAEAEEEEAAADGAGASRGGTDGCMA